VRAPVEYPQRIAMVSMHTSPLATPGVGDAGGLNVYVAEVARRLGERGIKVDVFTRAEDGGPEVVEVNEHTRVVQLPAGPRELVVKEELPALVPAFAEALSGRLEDHHLLHSHYWLSGMVGLDLARRHGLPLVHTMHTMARV
jgi:D-inositol-3-phosphate glycosyltransferase